MIKILVADDDFDNRSIAMIALESSGYVVCQAVNGSETLDIAEKEKPDIIFLDLSMPKLDGWQVAKQLKLNHATVSIPVIAFTAHAMTGDDIKAKNAGCDDVLTKPCTPKDLIRKVKEWVKES